MSFFGVPVTPQHGSISGFPVWFFGVVSVLFGVCLLLVFPSGTEDPYGFSTWTLRRNRPKFSIASRAWAVSCDGHRSVRPSITLLGRVRFFFYSRGNTGRGWARGGGAAGRGWNQEMAFQRCHFNGTCPQDKSGVPYRPDELSII